MAVNVRLSSLLRQAAGWQEVVQVEGETPLHCIEALLRRYPDMRRWIYDKHGHLWDRLQLFVNGEMIHGEDLLQPLAEGDEIHVLLNIGGG